jgi:thioesterase domain-containing protein
MAFPPCGEIEEYLHRHIPLSGAMGVQVVEASSQGVILGAPFEPNVNHQDTVFGGSASAVAILAAWTLVNFRLREHGIRCRVVIHRNRMHFEKPILGRFLGRTELPPEDEWEWFLNVYRRMGKSRVRIRCVLECEGERVARMDGHFVALR